MTGKERSHKDAGYVDRKGRLVEARPHKEERKQSNREKGTFLVPPSSGFCQVQIHFISTISVLFPASLSYFESFLFLATKESLTRREIGTKNGFAIMSQRKHEAVCRIKAE